MKKINQFFKLDNLNIILKSSEFIKYVIVGIVTNGGNFIMFHIFILWFGDGDFMVFDFRFTYYQLIETFVYILTILSNFTLNKLWSFQTKSFCGGEIFKYTLLLIFNWLVGLLVITFLHESFNVSLLLSKFVALGFIVCWNFFVLKHVVFVKSN